MEKYFKVILIKEQGNPRDAGWYDTNAGRSYFDTHGGWSKPNIEYYYAVIPSYDLQVSAEDFIKNHFKGIEKETWYPAMVAIAEGYAKLKNLVLNAQLSEKELDNNWSDVLSKFESSDYRTGAFINYLKTFYYPPTLKQ